MRRLLYVILMTCLLTGCGGDAHIADVIDCSDNLMAEHPDSALQIIDSALYSGRGSHHQRAKLRLRRLNAICNLDTVFNDTYVEHAKAIAEYFDRKGSLNERMVAHYVLGRIYTDVGLSPQAIKSYQESVECADTTSDNCNYRQLSLVYTKLGTLLCNQNLYQESLQCIDRAIKFGHISKDSLIELDAYAIKVLIHSYLSNEDSVLILSDMVSNSYLRMGYRHKGAEILMYQLPILINRKALEEARHKMDSYEYESDSSDKTPQMESLPENYYSAKGAYYLASGHNDSAVYYFRHELTYGNDFKKRDAASYGLAILFQKNNKPDSAAKYALYSHAMNDSAHNHETLIEMTKAKAMYDYELFERKAQQEKQRAEREHSMNTIIIILSAILIMAGISGFFYHRKKYIRKYRQVIQKLSEAQNNLLLLKTHDATLNAAITNNTESQKNEIERMKEEIAILDTTIQERETEIERQRHIISKFQQKEKFTKESADQIINHSKIYKHIRTIANQGLRLTDDDWLSLMQLIIQQLPCFYNLLSAKERELTRLEYQICLLERLDIEPRRMHYLLGISESYVSRIRDGLHLKLFGVPGNRQHFNKEIKALC